MTADDGRRGPDGPGEETTSAPKGTGAPVDVSVDPRARTTVAVLLAGPVIAALHFLLVYLVVEAGCTGDGPGLDRLDPPVPTVVTLVATAVAAAVAVATAAWAYRRWRGRPHDDGDGSAVELTDRRPLAFVGFLLSSLAVVTVLIVGLPALYLPACGPS